jgi:RHS repeat-associated protein
VHYAHIGARAKSAQPPAKSYIGERTRVGPWLSGKEEDIEVGLTYFGARYYAPYLGRWASADPLTIHALGSDLNPYAYVGGRVMSHVDPFGLCSAGNGGDCIGGAYHEDALGNQPPGSTVGDSSWTPHYGEGGLVGSMYRDWVASGRPSYGGIDMGGAGPERGMFWDVPPAPVYGYGTFGNNAASAGGVPTLGPMATTQNVPTSREDYLARKHPALAPQIRGAARQQSFLDQAPLALVAALASPALAAGAAESAAGEIGEGSFSITNWSGYPAGMARPVGPVRIIAGEEYAAARAAADETNAAIRAAYDLEGTGLHIHEIQPVKFGGSPIDPANKMLLPAGEHIGPNGVHPKFWTPLQRWATGGR